VYTEPVFFSPLKLCRCSGVAKKQPLQTQRFLSSPLTWQIHPSENISKKNNTILCSRGCPTFISSVQSINVDAHEQKNQFTLPFQGQYLYPFTYKTRYGIPETTIIPCPKDHIVPKAPCFNQF